MPIRNHQHTRAHFPLTPLPLLYSSRSKRPCSANHAVPRFFNLLEAEKLIPEVERLLRSLIRSKQEYEEVEAELAQIKQRIALTGGMVAPRGRIAQLRSRKDSAARALKSTVEQIQETGCQLKDIETGLIDFPTLYRDKEVYLCWKLGESGIGYWHHVEDGFRGRRPIDSDFLANHRGESQES
jgi:hypothetical protein